METKEKNFEESIEQYLCSDEGGYTKGDPQQFNRELALDTDTMLKFIKNTQLKEWQKFCRAIPNNPEEQFIKRFCKHLQKSDITVLDILRRGLETCGCKFNFVYWKPETLMNQDAVELYEKNILTCVRQLHYSPQNENSLDLTLFVNGIPLVTLELKNQLTGQTVKNAINQYKYDRSPSDPIFQFKKRVLINFAVDLYEVEMTTRLAGKNTFFMPFNQGSNGAGNVGGKGNPSTTDYLWRNVLKKDILLEIFHKYMLYDEKNDRIIFPRYHQSRAFHKF